ncbi:ABC transporter permease [Patescibacteria group bacterium]|nr:ABC transporter permease [Patescibacteria group bacterium]
MKLKDILLINIKKLKTKTKKALFLIIPIFVLITLSVILSSQITNIQEAMTQSVFGTISQKFTLIEVKTETTAFDPSKAFNTTSSVEDNRFSALDETTIGTIDGVVSVSLQTTLPVKNAQTTDLFTDKTVSFSSLSTLDTTAAAIYTTSDFTYTEGEAIPIILNASALTYSYEDWGDSTEITMDTSSITRGQGGVAQRLSFLKTEAISYDKDSLIGTTFTMSVGGLDSIQDYTMDRSSGSMVIKQLTDDEMATKVSDRETAISTYWDYDKISTPITYTFVVVGIVDDNTANTTYVPQDFGDILVTDYVAHEIASRNGTDIPTTVLNSTFTGVTYDGVEVKTSSSGMMGQMAKRMESSSSTSGSANTTHERPTDGGLGLGGEFGSTGYYIPGLVIQVDSSNNVTGAVSDSDVYATSTKYGDYLDVVIDNVVNRTAVIEDINNAGYAYQDTDDVAVFDKLQSTLSTVSSVFMISFIVLVSALVAFTMSKFISESIREIGIFRAIGMRKSSILTMFISQSLLYVLIGYAVGIGLGIALNFAAGYLVSGWFNTFLADTVAKTFNVVNTVDKGVFFGINFTSIGIYTALLIGISSIISVITSLSASKVSPVEAIKNE